MKDLSYIENANKQQKEIALSNIYNLMFNIKDFIGQWQEIEDTFKLFGFVPYKDNKEKINDYKYINDCFTNYIKKKQVDLRNNIEDFYKLEELVSKWCATTIQPKGEGWSPRFVVYIALRNSWLNLLATNIKTLIESEVK